MYLIIGLGNPGGSYAESRHNLGFMVVDRLAETWSLQIQGRRYQSLYGKGMVRGKPVVLVKPQTYMNLSGEAAAQWVGFYQAPPSCLLVVHDDLDLEPGRIKLVRKGGAGGHKGVASIIHRIGNEDIPRLKLGIGRPRFNEPIEQYVLSPFYEDERSIRDETVVAAAGIVELVISDGLDKVMNLIN